MLNTNDFKMKNCKPDDGQLKDIRYSDDLDTFNLVESCEIHSRALN